MELGIYEQLITTMLRSRLAALDDRKYYISETELDREEWNNTLGYVFLGDARFVKH